MRNLNKFLQSNAGSTMRS